MRTSIFLILFLLPFFNFGQTEYFTINSQILQDKRELKLQLPRTYNSSGDQRYPLIVVFDGNYLFEPIAGTVDYLSYWNEIPEAIIIGINQSETRNDDFQIGDKEFLPTLKGDDFLQFIENELLPLLEDKYRIAGFKVAVGHNKSANFINFFLLRKSLPFNGYISLSPLLSTKMAKRVENALKTKEERLFYNLSYGERDFEDVILKVRKLGRKLNTIEKTNADIDFNIVEGATHYTMVSRKIPIAIEQIFSAYRPITPDDYKEKLLNNEDIVGFLEEKYDKIEELYSIDAPVSVNDILFAAKAIKEKEKWDALKDLGKLAEKEQPEKILGPYYRALHYEKIGKPKKAIKYYQSAYSYESVDKITKDLVIDKVNELKELFGD